MLNFFFFLPKLLGSPDDASLGFLRSDNARRYVRQLPQCRKQQLSARFPSMSPGALDLLEKMLVFDPTKRITGTRNEFKFSRETNWLLFQIFCSPLSFVFIPLSHLQLKRHFVTHTCHLSMIPMMSLSLPGRSVLILSIQHVLKNKSKSSSGGSQ